MEQFMVELFVRGIVLCLLVRGALLLLRRSAAAYRHLLCVIALGGLVALPFAQRLMPALKILPPPSTAISIPVNDPVKAIPRVAEARPPAEWASSLPVPRPQTLPSETTSAPPQDNVSPPQRVTPRPAYHPNRSQVATLVLVGIWGLGTAALLIRLMVALVHLRRLEASGSRQTLGDIPVLVSDQVDTPLTWGIRRNIILLPASLLSGDPTVRESALLHEQAHIARRDWLWNLLAETACAACWFQPGVWWLRRRMRLESERACDDRVLLSGIAGPDYAAHLLQILRSVRTNEIAPAMAHCGGIEERMKHILDINRPRRTNRLWLIATAPIGLAVLSFAALRVSARPADVKSVNGPEARILKSDFKSSSILPSQPQNASRSPGEPRTSYAFDLPFAQLPPISASGTVPVGQPNGAMTMVQPGITSPQGDVPAASALLPDSAVAVKGIVWGDVVDGLQTGFLFNTRGLPSQKLPVNSRVTYQVLVRNTTHVDRNIEVQCQNFNELNPYVIPESDAKHALTGGAIPDTYRAIGIDDGREVFPAYPVKLAPGEAVVVPGDLELYLGDVEKQIFPRVEKIKQGLNWIVQPLTIQLLSPTEATEAQAGEKNIKLTILGHDGKSSTRPTTWRAMGTGGTRRYAKFRLEVGIFPAANLPMRQAPSSGMKLVQDNAPATAKLPNPTLPGGNIAWGEAVNGLQPGILLQSPEAPANRQFPLNSKLVYHLLVRNTSRTERVIEIQSRDFFGMDPYLIPDADLPKAFDGGKIPELYRSQGVTELVIAFLSYAVKLAPGESVLVPDPHSLYVGDADAQQYPRIEKIVPGKNWIVQPIMVRTANPTEGVDDLASITSPYGNGINMTILKRDGTPAWRLGAKGGMHGSSPKLYPKISLDITTPHAQNPPIEMPIQWGEKASGFQVGATIVPNVSAFNVGDTITFKAFGRNLSGKDVSLDIGNYWKVNYKIQVQTLDGKPIYTERDRHNQVMQVAGYRADSLRDGESQEISGAMLKITVPVSARAATLRHEGDDSWVETVPLKPGRYRVRLVSWRLFGTHQPEPASGWIPIEVKA